VMRNANRNDKNLPSDQLIAPTRNPLQPHRGRAARDDAGKARSDAVCGELRMHDLAAEVSSISSPARRSSSQNREREREREGESPTLGILSFSWKIKIPEAISEERLCHSALTPSCFIQHYTVSATSDTPRVSARVRAFCAQAQNRCSRDPAH